MFSQVLKHMHILLYSLAISLYPSSDWSQDEVLNLLPFGENSLGTDIENTGIFCRYDTRQYHTEIKDEEVTWKKNEKKKTSSRAQAIFLYFDNLGKILIQDAGIDTGY